ncbi:hypothetical protein AeRB84_015905 [Aphanomyces euteiches]|nr:hypothetical protein AeRB84_015905 [Aphanomyces euteiches]
MSDASVFNSNQRRSISVHVDDVQIMRKRQLIPSCLFRGRVKVGKLPEWTIQFSQKELLRLHICVNLFLLWRFEKPVGMPWTLLWEKRASKRIHDRELIERYLSNLVDIPELHECEPLMSFLEISALRLQTNMRALSIKEGYVHMKINGPNQIPLQKFCSPRMEKVYRHSYRMFLRIAFVASMLLMVWPFMIIVLVAVVNPTFLRQIVDSSRVFVGENAPYAISVAIVVLLVLFCLAFVYKFFERRLGTVRRWAAIKSNCIAFFRHRTDVEPSEVFLFDTHFEVQEGNYRQGVSWMVNGMTVRNKGGYVEIDCGHYYTRIISAFALSLAFFIVVNISSSSISYHTARFDSLPVQVNATINITSGQRNDWFCGYVFEIPSEYSSIFKNPDMNATIMMVKRKPPPSQEYYRTQDYTDQGIFGELLTPRLLSSWASTSRGQMIAVVGSLDKTYTYRESGELVLPSFHRPTRFNGIYGRFDEVNTTIHNSTFICDIPVEVTALSPAAVSILIGALLVASLVASSFGIFANYLVSYAGIWHAHVRRDLWLDVLNNLPPQPHRNRFLSFAPHRPQAWLKWHVDGHDTYDAMRKAILAAKHSILIAGWWVCPDLLLERHDAPNRIPLKELLLQKAQEGVRIHILLYQEVNVAMDLGSYYAMKQLKRHPNIRVLRDPAFQVQSFGFWSHHEKVIVADFDIAFVGGLDLAFGRYDTCHHSLSDPGHDSMTHLWPGKDYSNPIIKDFVRVNNPNEELIDRNNVPRMPWHDVHCSILGPPVQDVANHFIERWNFVCSKQDNALRTDWCVCCRTRRFKYLPKCIIPWTANTTEFIPPPEYEPCELQVLRSVSSWSAGVPTETSIHTAYCDRIRMAKHYVYIENQFFISGLDDNTVIMNRIVQALVDRISFAHLHHQVFRVFVVMPLLPGIEGNIQSRQSLTHLHAVMHWQYETIRSSLMGALSKITSKPEDYVMFFGLRTYGLMPNGRCVTEQIYIHSKVFISDDTTVICGSANINDRSMNGDRDSEIAIVMEDSTFSQGSMNGVPYDQGTLATRLRLQLFQEHLGLADPTPVLDPTTESTWQFLKSRAQANTDVFEQVFRCAPSNMYRSFNCFDTQWHQLDEIYENQRLNPLKGRAAWGPQNLLADGDYAPWTDVNGVPIPIEKINWEEYVVVPDPLFPALSTDDQGWYYARNFKIFQEMRVHSGNHQANIRVRKRDKFQHFMADRLLAQVRRRKYVKLSTLPVLNGEYVDTVPVLRDDDKDTFYAKWRQWASKKLKPPPTSVTEYHEMTESSHHAEESKRSHIPSRHSDSELDFPRQRPVLRLSESDIKAPRREDQVREPPRSWLAALELGLPPMLFRTTHSDRFDSSVGDMDDIHILSPTPSVVSSTLQNDIQLGNVHTNAETQEVSAQATLQAIQGHLVVFPLEFLAEETLKPSILPRSLHI